MDLRIRGSDDRSVRRRHLSGAVLAVEGPAWWHKSNVGLFVNSMHMWGTDLFFMFMVVHLWGRIFMAAWRGRRKATWITGVITFVVSIGTAFTGYLSQQNFDSEWISTQAKDGINSTGIGAFWNVLNFGQMLMWHIVLLPLLVTILIALHVLLVRRRGVVPPFAPTEANWPRPGWACPPPCLTRRPYRGHGSDSRSRPAGGADPACRSPGAAAAATPSAPPPPSPSAPPPPTPSAPPAVAIATAVAAGTSEPRPEPGDP